MYAGNYGEAGALERFGKRAGRSVPVIAGQNAYGEWGPPAGTPTNVIAIGQFDRNFLELSWSRVEQVGSIDLPAHLENDESEDAAIYWCTGPRGTWAQLWTQLSYLS